MSELYFSFGAMADKFSKQCEEQGYNLKNAETYDKLVDCVIMLWLNGILTDSRYDDCLNKIIKKSKKDMEMIKEQKDGQ